MYNNNEFRKKLEDFFNTDVEDEIKFFINTNKNDLVKKSQENVLKGFHQYAPKIKGYMKFLKERSINIDNIRTINDFEKLPITTKDNYILKYNFEDLVTDLAYVSSITSSTGSTGNPIYWPRGTVKDIDLAKEYEFLFHLNYGIKNKKTLIIVSLGMGVWNSANITIAASILIGYKGYESTLITPGLNMEENIKIIKKFIHSEYDQIIFIAYPGFVKDIFRECIINGIDITKKDIFVLVGGESITEEWRQYIYNQLDKENDGKRVVSLIGSSEGGIVAIETQYTNLLKMYLQKHPEKINDVFATKTMPTVTQYNPLVKYLEESNNNVILTYFGVFPAIRYDTRDSGGIYFKEEIEKRLGRKFDVKDELNLPIVYIKGRSDVALTIYSVNIYIDNIKHITYSLDLLKFITGRFQAYIEYDKEENQIFYIKLELNSGIDENTLDKNYILEYIISNLRKLNSEYNKLYASLGKKVSPIISYEEYVEGGLFSHDKPIYKKIKK